jgi:hypothetical protein
MDTLTKFTQAYIVAALWASTGDDGEPLDNAYSQGDIAPEALQKISADCAEFLADPATMEIVERLGADRCGHDFWLTRNRHGAGFWDRGYSDSDEQALMARTRPFPEIDLYAGDDGRLYF